MNILQVQITKAINSAINNSVIPEIQNAMGTLSSGQRDTESGSSQNNQEDREGSNGLKTKIIKTDSRSACNLRDTEAEVLTLWCWVDESFLSICANDLPSSPPCNFWSSSLSVTWHPLQFLKSFWLPKSVMRI